MIALINVGCAWAIFWQEFNRFPKELADPKQRLFDADQWKRVID
ncbi:hypothetical protein [Calycomorphotria hydatis]|nr:hypothetical protein [Calycomorphotria hydatis]